MTSVWRTALAAWRRQPGAIKVLIAAIGVIAMLNIAAALLGNDDEPEGTGSSLATTDPRGFGGYASLLRSYGYPVDVTIGAEESPLEGGEGTVVLLGTTAGAKVDPEPIREFAEEGGTLMLDPRDDVLVDSLFGDRLELLPTGPVDSTPVGGDETGVEEVRATGEGSWVTAGGGEPVVAGPGGVLLLEAEIGDGRAYLFADTSPLQNRLLDQADNALLGLELAGSDGEQVTFGLSSATLASGVPPETEDGLAALPDEWIAAILGLIAAALIGMAARARRIGPPEDPDRDLMPARGAYVNAVGSALARNGDRDAVASRLREVALTRLTRTSMVDLGSDPGRLDEWLRSRGLDPEEASALARGQAKTKEEMMLAASGLAKLTEKERATR